jgi:hypothetical protein
MIPLIIPNFNQLTYLVNLITWWNYYTNNAPVFVLDNKSTYGPLLDFYDDNHFYNLSVFLYEENNCGNNLKKFIESNIKGYYEYYCISNPDIMPHPGTPENFLSVMMHCIDRYKFHHAGFCLVKDDLPDFIDNKDIILRQENKFWYNPKAIEYNGSKYTGYLAPIDLTFCMYTTKNSGWHYPMDRTDWNNSIRIFNAFHFGWYISPQTNIEEVKQYYKTCLKRSQTKSIKGVNNYKPSTL